MNGNVELRLTVESMRHDLVTHLSKYKLDMSDAIGEALAKEIEAFDYNTAVREEARRVIREAVKGAVASTVNTMFYEPELRERMKATLREILLEDE